MNDEAWRNVIVLMQFQNWSLRVDHSHGWWWKANPKVLGDLEAHCVCRSKTIPSLPKMPNEKRNFCIAWRVDGTVLLQCTFCTSYQFLRQWPAEIGFDYFYDWIILQPLRKSQNDSCKTETLVMNTVKCLIGNSKSSQHHWATQNMRFKYSNR